MGSRNQIIAKDFLEISEIHMASDSMLLQSPRTEVAMPLSRHNPF